ncbi:MAG: C39 family peptidase [Deltaproteobacteria bacterium]|nr:C39 family peptidase [Deltaproteobacteria bacterium]
MAASTPVNPSLGQEDIAPAIERIDKLCEQALYLQAWTAAQALGPLEQWKDADGWVVGARLATHLGAPALARRLCARAYRRAPSDARVRARTAMHWIEKRGPLEIHELLTSRPLHSASPGPRMAEYHVARAQVAIVMRDFETADQQLARVGECNPEECILPLMRSARLQAEDRLQDALEVVLEDLAKRPRSRPSLQQAAAVLWQLGRREEAFERLWPADAVLESHELRMQLYGMLFELERYEEAQAMARRAAESSPLLEPEGRGRIAAALSECAWRLGDRQGALRHAREAKSEFYDRLARRIEKSVPAGRTVRLEVPRIRQGYLTCVPATLAVIAGYWGVEIDPSALARDISYEGTPRHKERAWVENHGWCVREFRATWESARTLLDRGVPFALHTAYPSSGHAHVVMGYDEVRGLWLIRDPDLDSELKADAPGLLDQQAPWGPRGMAFVPKAKAELLQGVELCEAPLYDLLHALEVALDVHERATAARILDELEAQAPGSRLAIAARRALAAYDQDHAALLQAAEAQLGLYPQDARAQLDACAAMDRIAPRGELLARLETWCSRDDASSWVLMRLASELAYDPRTSGRGRKLLRRALRASPVDADIIAERANVLWARRRFDDALDGWRFASCLRDRNETYARAYFVASLMRRKSAPALALIEARAQRLGDQSGAPVSTLFWALQALDRTAEAFGRLDSALAQRSEDGELLLFAAREHAVFGRLGRAQELLQAARGRVREAEWLRASCAIASRTASASELLELWREVLRLEPFAEDAQRNVIALLAALQGRAAADAHFGIMIAQFPYHRALRRLQAAWLEHSDPVARTQAVKHLLEVDPADAWAHRELVLALASKGEFQQAHEAVQEAVRLAPEDPATFCVQASLLLREGDEPAGMAALHEALRRQPDAGPALLEILALDRSAQGRKSLLDAIAEQWVVGGIHPETILAWHHAARAHCEPEALLSTVDELRKARPESWATWCLCIRQRLLAGQTEQAEDLAVTMLERFPMVSQCHAEVAELAELRGSIELQRSALEHAVMLDSSSAQPAIRLARILERQGDVERARSVLQRALTAFPLDSNVRLSLAVMLRRGGDPEALAVLERALDLDSDNEQAGDLLFSWSSTPELSARAKAIILELADARPWSASLQLLKAGLAAAADQFEEALGICRAVQADHPGNVSAHAAAARLLVQLGRRDEALAACKPTALSKVPVDLRAVEAWVHWVTGDVEAGLARLQDLLAQAPEYTQGWADLIQWESQRHNLAGSQRACERLLRLLPTSRLVRTWYAHILMTLGKRKTGLAEFARSLDIGGCEPELALRTFHVARLAGDLALAERAVQEIERTEPSQADVPALLLALERDDPDAASIRLRKLCLRQESDPAWIDRCRLGFLRAGYCTELHEQLGAICDDPDAHPRAVAWWAATEASRRGASLLDALPGWAPNSARSRIALHTLLGGAVQELRGSGRKVCWRLRGWLRSNDELWEQAAIDLVDSGQLWTAAWWCSGWRRRKLSARGCHAVAIALRGAWMTGASAAACRRGLKLDSHAATRSRLAVLGAFESALAGKIASASLLIEGVSEPLLDPRHVYYLTMTRIMVAVRSVQGRDRVRAWHENSGKMPPIYAAQTLTQFAWDVYRVRARLAADMLTLDAMAYAHVRWIVLVVPLLLLPIVDKAFAVVTYVGLGFLALLLISIRILAYIGSGDDHA